MVEKAAFGISSWTGFNHGQKMQHTLNSSSPMEKLESPLGHFRPYLP